MEVDKEAQWRDVAGLELTVLDNFSGWRKMNKRWSLGDQEKRIVVLLVTLGNWEEDLIWNIFIIEFFLELLKSIDSGTLPLEVLSWLGMGSESWILQVSRWFWSIDKTEKHLPEPLLESSVNYKSNRCLLWKLFNSIMGYKVKLIFSSGQQLLMLLFVVVHRCTSIHKSLFKMVLN